MEPSAAFWLHRGVALALPLQHLLGLAGCPRNPSSAEIIGREWNNDVNVYYFLLLLSFLSFFLKGGKRQINLPPYRATMSDASQGCAVAAAAGEE